MKKEVLFLKILIVYFIQKIILVGTMEVINKMSSQDFLKKRDFTLKKLLSNNSFSAIVTFLTDLFSIFLIRFDQKITAFIPENKKMLLETSNIPRLDEIMNETQVD